MYAEHEVRVERELYAGVVPYAEEGLYAKMSAPRRWPMVVRERPVRGRPMAVRESAVEVAAEDQLQRLERQVPGIPAALPSSGAAPADDADPASEVAGPETDVSTTHAQAHHTAAACAQDHRGHRRHLAAI